MLRCEEGGDVVRARTGRADLRRRRLLDTARALFVEHGFHGTGVAQIAAASGIKVGQIYRDFDGKEAIIAAICEADVTAWLEEDGLRAAVRAGDGEAIRGWIRRFGGFDEPAVECRLLAEITAETGRNERVAAIHRGIDARLRACLVTALAALVPGCGRAGEVAALADFVLAAGVGIKMRRVIRPDLPHEPFGRLMGEVVDGELARLAGG